MTPLNLYEINFFSYSTVLWWAHQTACNPSSVIFQEHPFIPFSSSKTPKSPTIHFFLPWFLYSHFITVSYFIIGSGWFSINLPAVQWSFLLFLSNFRILLSAYFFIRLAIAFLESLSCRSIPAGRLNLRAYRFNTRNHLFFADNYSINRLHKPSSMFLPPEAF